MDVNIDPSWSCNQPFRIACGCRGAAYQMRIHTIHDRRITALSDPDNKAILNADIALYDAKDGIDNHGIANDHVERP